VLLGFLFVVGTEDVGLSGEVVGVTCPSVVACSLGLYVVGAEVVDC